MSESRLNTAAISTYSEQVSSKIIAEFFKSKKKITGNEIVKMTPVKQINYFILKNLFTTWQEESARLKSPYFDYSNEDVRKSMQTLMNVLSKNILIKEEDLKPILKDAVYQTLFLTLSPYDYYHRNIASCPSLNLKYLRSQARYIRINKHLYMNLLEVLENEPDDKILNEEEVYEKLDSIFKRSVEGPEDIDNYVKEFVNICPVEVDDFFTEDIVLTPNEEAEIDEIQHNLFQDFEEMDELAIEKSRQQLNDRFATEEKTLNDKLATDTIDIATAHASKKIENIQKSISINQKYLFVKELFDGNNDVFDSAVSEIEDCPTFEDAVGLLVQNYAREYHWNMQSREIKDFLKVIIKKFK